MSVKRNPSDETMFGAVMARYIWTKTVEELGMDIDADDLKCAFYEWRRSCFAHIIDEYIRDDYKHPDRLFTDEECVRTMEHMMTNICGSTAGYIRAYFS